MSDTPTPADGGILPPSAVHTFAAVGAAAAMAAGPWAVPGCGPWSWTVSDLKRDTEGWASLCATRGVNSAAPLLKRLRRQVLQRVYANTKQSKKGGHGSAAAVAPAVSRPLIDAEAYFAALDAARPSDGPFMVEGLGAWSLAELQLDRRKWASLLTDRGVIQAPPELKKLRRMMLGRVYAKTTSRRAGRESSSTPMSCSPMVCSAVLAPSMASVEWFDFDVTDVAAFSIDAAAKAAEELCNWLG